MMQTLFHIPAQIDGIPVFGFGLLLAAWSVFSVLLLAWLVWRQGFSADTLGYIPLMVLIGAAIWFLFPRLSEPEGLPIRGYGVMLLVAVAAAVALAAWRAHRVGIDPEVVFALAFWAFVPGIIGARLFYVIEYWPAFERPTLGATLVEIVNVTEGGLVVYGSLIGGLLGLIPFMLYHRLPLLATFDLIAPSLALGVAIGRWGCLLNGCCFGSTCDLPWAITFPPGSPAHVHQVDHGDVFLHGLKIGAGAGGRPIIAQVEPGSPAERQGLEAGDELAAVGGREVRSVEEARQELLQFDAPGKEILVRVQGDSMPHRWPTAAALRSAPVHPTQIYSSINALVICLFLLAYDPFRRRDGELWALLLTLYPMTRFLLEMIRDDEPGVLNTSMTPAQNVSLLAAAVGVALWFYLWRKPRGTAFPTWREPSAAC